VSFFGTKLWRAVILFYWSLLVFIAAFGYALIYSTLF
jgi:hypothetical protein